MARSVIWAILALSASGAAGAAGPVTAIEPPNWWVGMKHRDLQLMVHGDSVSLLQPSLEYPGVSVTGVVRTPSANYLFINLAIGPEARPGTLEIEFRKDGVEVEKVPYRLDERRPGSADRRGFDSRDAVYLLVPDRFANGDPGNDSRPDLAERADRSSPTGRHGGDLRGMRDHLDYIAAMGFTMVWPTPLLENDMPRYSYHGYAITDEYKVDGRFGTNEDYRAFVAEARARGIGIIQDVVLNHIGTGHVWMRDPPAPDWLNYPSGDVMTNNQHTTVMDIHAAPGDRQRFLDGWFVKSMPDLNQRNPLVATYLIQCSLWWIEYADLSGIREDTYSYSDTEFLKAWSNSVMGEYPNFNIVGEEMNDNPQIVAYWQRGVADRDGYRSGLRSLMDFPVTDLAPQVLNERETRGSGFIRLYEMIANDFLYANPMDLMVFPDNHDRPRIFSVLHENLDLWRTLMLFTATTRGIPEYFYGTEILARSPIERNDGLLRADMPGGWAGDTVNAFSGSGLSPDQASAQAYLRRLLLWRRTSTAVTDGKLMHFIPGEGVYVYFRYDATDTVMVVLNKNAGDTALDLGRFRGMLKGRTSGTDVMSGGKVDLTRELRLKAMTSVAVQL